MTNTFNPRWFLPPFFLVEDILEEKLESGLWSLEDSIRIQALVGLTEEDVAALRTGAKPIDDKLASKLSYFYGGRKEYWLSLEKNFREDLNNRKAALGFLNIPFFDICTDGGISLSIGLLGRYELNLISSCRYDEDERGWLSGDGWFSIELLDFQGPGQPLNIFNAFIGV